MYGSKLLNAIAVAVIAFMCIMAAIDLGYFVFSQNIPLLSIESPILFPFLVVLVLIASLASILARGIASRAKKQDSDKNEDENIKDLKAAAAYFAGMAIYVMALKNLHFIVGTIAFMFAAMYVLHQKERMSGKVFKILLSCLITVPAVYFVFSGIFRVILP